MKSPTNDKASDVQRLVMDCDDVTGDVSMVPARASHQYETRYVRASDYDALAAELLSARAALEAAEKRIAELEPAAECWDAIAACYRITCMGSAGLLGKMDATGYAHATFNLWTCAGTPPDGATGDEQDKHGRERLADFMLVATANYRAALPTPSEGAR
jgi:hypothetical protein